MQKKQLKITYEEGTIDNLEKSEQELVSYAILARDQAYAPYSHFKVGAAIQTIRDEIITGANQETAAYHGSHAEKVALDSAAMIGRKDQVSKIAIFGLHDSQNPGEEPKDPEQPCTPCGLCRQDLKEAEDLSNQPLIIIMASRNKVIRVTGIDNLLPWAFGPASLGIKFK